MEEKNRSKSKDSKSSSSSSSSNSSEKNKEKQEEKEENKVISIKKSEINKEEDKNDIIQNKPKSKTITSRAKPNTAVKTNNKLKTYKTNYNLKKDVNFSNNNSQSLRSAKTKNNLKKTVTSYPSSTNKKFNANEFKKQLDSFNDWEVKRKAKLKQMQQEKIEKEKNLLKNPTINNEANLKFNTNPKNYELWKK